jgi:adenylate kinase
VDAGEEMEPEDDAQAQEDKTTLEEIVANREENKGRLDDRFITSFYIRKLHSKPCQNQGFIIDGYPKTAEQAKDLFAGAFV